MTPDSAVAAETSVDLIILDVDGGAMLQACLASINAQTVIPRRVIVWDNGSRIPVADRINPTYRFDLVIRRSEGNLGFTGGINRAMELVDATSVAWVNNDAQLDPEWLSVLGDALNRDPKLGAVQSRIRRDGRTLDGAGIEIASGTFVQAGHGASIESYQPRAAAWGVSATAAVYRVEALRSVAFRAGVLHPEFFAWYEDVELCARLHAKGWRTEVFPRVLATHLGSGSAESVGSRALFLRTRNRYWTARMHPGTGRIRSLLMEDLRLSLRALLRAQFGHVGQSARGVVAGMTSKVPADQVLAER